MNLQQQERQRNKQRESFKVKIQMKFQRLFKYNRKHFIPIDSDRFNNQMAF